MSKQKYPGVRQVVEWLDKRAMQLASADTFVDGVKLGEMSSFKLGVAQSIIQQLISDSAYRKRVTAEMLKGGK